MVEAERLVCWRGSLILLLLGACAPDPDFDVQSVVVCSECVLTLDGESIRFEDSQLAPLQLPASIASLEDGFVTVGLDTDHVLFRYDALGKHIATVERSGQGPGEFLRITSLVGFDGGVIALDAGNQRRSVLSSDLELIAESPLSFQPQWRGHARTAAGLEFVKSTVRANGEVTSGISLLLEDGTVGEPVHWPYGGLVGLSVMPVPATDSTVWVYHFDTGRIVEFGREGRPLREVSPPPWFVPGGVPQRARDGDPAPPSMSLVSVAQGSPWLLALYSVPDPRWDGSTPTDSRDRLASLDDTRDSILHLIDPDTGETVAALRMDEYAEFVLPEMRLVQVGLSSRGEPRVTVRSIRLEGPVNP